MLHMGFSSTWTNRVMTLYLLVANVLGHMLEDPKRGVISFMLPDGSRTTNLMFADDTNLLLKGTEANLDIAMQVLSTFCEATDAKLNESKLVAIWASRQPRDWTRTNDLGIVWLAEGANTKYLGSPIGFKMNPANRDRKVIIQLTKQLMISSPRKLSMTGRHLIVNQVLLASIWYLCSCASLTTSAFKQIRGIVRNYLWGAKLDKHTRAKVSWAIAVQLIAVGGLKVLDPAMQARALLTKLLDRGLSPEYAPWKTLVRHRVNQTRLMGGGKWTANAHFVMQPRAAPLASPPLWKAVHKAFSTIRQGLDQIPPTTFYEKLRQPIFANSLIKSSTGTPFGCKPMT
ncbi:hypothetical protein KC19_VG050800 [Ceratodon purpureus]|uniref:Reverse transcriptase domain-containing protein n=1 Tax=Ceratodon purpureus TaxID=3225 RepID=A0A8T0HM29_CERPU|nr:hypothetical protein KC19_VG050800 [Ceratodon purpureus]